MFFAPEPSASQPGNVRGFPPRPPRVPQPTEGIMASTAADVLVETLQDWGVEVVFGLPGDGINGIMEALRKRKDHIRFIQTRHEESAAFAAVGYVKFSGKLGV